MYCLTSRHLVIAHHIVNVSSTIIPTCAVTDFDNRILIFVKCLIINVTGSTLCHFKEFYVIFCPAPPDNSLVWCRSNDDISLLLKILLGFQTSCCDIFFTMNIQIFLIRTVIRANKLFPTIPPTPHLMELSMKANEYPPTFHPNC